MSCHSGVGEMRQKCPKTHVSILTEDSGLMAAKCPYKVILNVWAMTGQTLFASPLYVQFLVRQKLPKSHLIGQGSSHYWLGFYFMLFLIQHSNRCGKSVKHNNSRLLLFTFTSSHGHGQYVDEKERPLNPVTVMTACCSSSALATRVPSTHTKVQRTQLYSGLASTVSQIKYPKIPISQKYAYKTKSI